MFYMFFTFLSLAFGFVISLQVFTNNYHSLFIQEQYYFNQPDVGLLKKYWFVVEKQLLSTDLDMLFKTNSVSKIGHCPAFHIRRLGPVLQGTFQSYNPCSGDFSQRVWSPNASHYMKKSCLFFRTSVFNEQLSRIFLLDT